MPPYDAQATRRRLLDAALAEFAEYGIAGARVDRIAEAAKSNKAQIYHYFGGKTQLFDAVFQQATMEMEAEVPFDPHDLPGYAGRLARLHERRPEIIRICTWQRLERADGEPNPLGVAFARSQVEVIAEAQQAGKLPAHFAPGFLLGLVLHIATGWAVVSPEYAAAIDVPDPDERVRQIENAIRQLLGQPSAQPPGSRPEPSHDAGRPAHARPASYTSRTGIPALTSPPGSNRAND
jgi:AcrR family transcriptional regulator